MPTYFVARSRFPSSSTSDPVTVAKVASNKQPRGNTSQQEAGPRGKTSLQAPSHVVTVMAIIASGTTVPRGKTSQQTRKHHTTAARENISADRPEPRGTTSQQTLFLYVCLVRARESVLRREPACSMAVWASAPPDEASERRSTRLSCGIFAWCVKWHQC